MCYTGMRQITLFIFALALSCLQESGAQQPAEGLTLTVTNLRNNNGFVLISLYKDGSGYPDDAARAVRNEKVAIYNNRAVIIFPELSSGSYGIAILHDENNDQKMNKNALGLPKEGYGFSNNVMGAFGPPSWKRASFRYNAGEKKEVSIRARY